MNERSVDEARSSCTVAASQGLPAWRSLGSKAVFCTSSCRSNEKASYSSRVLLVSSSNDSGIPYFEYDCIEF